MMSDCVSRGSNLNLEQQSKKPPKSEGNPQQVHLPGIVFELDVIFQGVASLEPLGTMRARDGLPRRQLVLLLLFDLTGDVSWQVLQKKHSSTYSA